MFSISRSALITLVLAFACVIPVLANTNPVSCPPASGFYCSDDDDFFADGGFTRWVTSVTAPYHVFTFNGNADGSDSAVGLRLDTADLPAKTLTFNYNTVGSSDPTLFIVYRNKAGFAGDTLIFDLPIASATGLTLHGNHYKFDAVAAGFGGTKFETIWIYDAAGGFTTGPEKIDSVYVDGIPVQPVTDVKTLADCTPPFVGE